MSIFSSPQGTPVRVLSLVQLLQSFGPLSVKEIQQWFAPREVGQEITAVKETIAVAKSLGLVATVEGKLNYEAATSIESISELADHVWHHLSNLHDSVDEQVFREFGKFLKTCDLEGRNQGSWHFELTIPQFCDRLNSSVNPTNIRPWWRWLRLIGVVQQIMDNKHYPSVSYSRGERIVKGLFHGEEEINGREFCHRIATQVPFLPGGRYYDHDFDTHVPWSFSQFLLDLQEGGLIEFIAVADSPRSLRLQAGVGQSLPSVDRVKVLK